MKLVAFTPQPPYSASTKSGIRRTRDAVEAMNSPKTPNPRLEGSTMISTLSGRAATLALLFVGGFASNTAYASILPSGPQLNVAQNTVENVWGWTQVYSGAYGQSGIPIASVFGTINPTDYVMLAAKRVGSSTFDLLAAALASDVMTVTAHNATTNSNGSEWYWNNESLGFALGGDTISQNSADVNDSIIGVGVNGDYRLSWHTSGVGPGPGNLDGGWRVGKLDYFLNSEPTGWERFVYVATQINGPGTVPEPATLVVWSLLGLGGAYCVRRRSCGSDLATAT